MKNNFKGRFVKLIFTLLTALLMCGITGCSSKENPSSIVDNFDPVPVPEGGWTVESLSKTIRINGKALPEPFTVENLGKQYSVKLSPNGEAGYLRFENKDIAMVVFSKEDQGDNYRSREITHLVLNNPVAADIITINGVGITASSDNVRRCLGDYIVPSENESKLCGYYFSNNEWDDNWWNNAWILMVVFDDSNRVKLMRFDF